MARKECDCLAKDLKLLAGSTTKKEDQKSTLKTTASEIYSIYLACPTTLKLPWLLRGGSIASLIAMAVRSLICCILSNVSDAGLVLLLMEVQVHTEYSGPLLIARPWRLWLDSQLMSKKRKTFTGLLLPENGLSFWISPSTQNGAYEVT